MTEQLAAVSQDATFTISKLLIRFYKSFNTNSIRDDSRSYDDQWMPWNNLPVKNGASETPDFPFIELTLERDITTIVGANESGKSQLLNALSIILTGKTIENKPYSFTDLCRYTGVRTQNIEVLPQIGAVFQTTDKQTFEDLISKLGLKNTPIPRRYNGFYRIAIIITPIYPTEESAAVYCSESQEMYSITLNQVEQARSLLPKIHFIRSNESLSSEVSVEEVIYSLSEDRQNAHPWAGLSRSVAKTLIEQILSLKTPFKENVLDAASATTLGEIFGLAQNIRQQRSNDRGLLERLIFHDLLNVKIETLKSISKEGNESRGFVESLVDKWNEDLDDVLNLNQFWRQDDRFTLKLNYKDQVLYFEIKDKTGSTYTFRDRSSGMKFFLSYYIQARAIEMKSRSSSSIIVMDEPDNALSVMGQRNLLAVFESLVRPSGNQIQLVYTTHSQHLINRNYPRRIRVVRKGDAEEGSQIVRSSYSRRYEPVRSALGLDGSLSLLQGSSNVVLEGNTDQLIISELIRDLSNPETIHRLLDLNEYCLIPVGGANKVGKLLEDFLFEEEAYPPTVVMLDGDTTGSEEVEKLRRVMKEKCPGVEFGNLSDATGEPLCKTAEDIIPRDIYIDAVHEYYKKADTKWYEENESMLRTETDLVKSSDVGLAEAIGLALVKLKQCRKKNDYDKIGVAFVALDLLINKPEFKSMRDEVDKRIYKICEWIEVRMEKSREKTKTDGARTSVKRLIRDLLRSNPWEIRLVRLSLHLARIQSEVSPVGEKVPWFLKFLDSCISEINRYRSIDKTSLVGDEYSLWRKHWEKLAKEPFEYSRKEFQGNQCLFGIDLQKR